MAETKRRPCLSPLAPYTFHLDRLTEACRDGRAWIWTPSFSDQPRDVVESVEGLLVFNDEDLHGRRQPTLQVSLAAPASPVAEAFLAMLIPQSARVAKKGVWVPCPLHSTLATHLYAIGYRPERWYTDLVVSSELTDAAVRDYCAERADNWRSFGIPHPLGSS